MANFNERVSDILMFAIQFLGSVIFIAIGIWIVAMLAKIAVFVIMGIWHDIHKQSQEKFVNFFKNKFKKTKKDDISES